VGSNTSGPGEHAARSTTLTTRATCRTDGGERKAERMNVAGWVCVGIVAWFVVSCGIGLLIGAAIIRATAEQARFRVWEAMAFAADRRSAAEDDMTSRPEVQSRSAVARPDVGPAPTPTEDRGAADRVHTA
jgi:hypothetical protein